MLYLVGGSSRSGKSALAERMNLSLGLSWLAVDHLRMGLFKGAPQLGVHPSNPEHEDARRLWPIVEEMCNSLIADGRDYLIEGVCLSVPAVADFVGTRPHHARACFLGYCDIDLADKVRLARAHPNEPYDWLAGKPDNEVYGHITYSIEHSRKIRDECLKAGLPFIDTGLDFEAGLMAAERVLSGDDQG